MKNIFEKIWWLSLIHYIHQILSDFSLVIRIPQKRLNDIGLYREEKVKAPGGSHFSIN